MSLQLEALRKSPIIVDQETITPDSVILRGRGSLGSGHSEIDSASYSDLLSMSTYDKSHEVAFDYNHGTTRPDQAPGYSSFAQPTYDHSYIAPHAQVSSGIPLHLMSGDQYNHVDASYNPQGSTYQPFMAAGSRQLPQVSSFSPDQGPAGRKLFVYLAAPDDLQGHPAYYFAVTFGSKRCMGVLSRLSGQAQSNFAVSVEIPPFHSTGSSSTNVDLYLDMSEGDTSVLAVGFGRFSYTDATAYGVAPSPNQMRKRKLSDSIGVLSPGKRHATLQHQPREQLDGTASSPHSADTLSEYSPANGGSNYAYTNGPGRSQQYQGFAQNVQSTPRYAVSPQPTTSQLSVNAQTPTPMYSPYAQSASLQMSTPMTMQAPLTPLSTAANPPLIRTSALQDHTVTASPMSASGFNSYSMFPSKATIKLEGDLDTMTHGWTDDEVRAQRRLVRFRRSQTGGHITATFEPVTPEDHARAPGNIYVNCIWWKEKRECYITSVDTIQLLQSLVATRFSVDEKNRIRRNLEGFRPYTVSKTRGECEEFFKTIMGFPSPKPRNIEKDVKVFPWRILIQALHKIIGKYSATPSSVPAGRPITAGNASTSSNGTGMQRHTASPPSASSSSAAVQYPPSMNNNPIVAHAAGGYGSAGLPMPQSTASNSVSWHQPTSSFASEFTHGRPSWDFSQYIDSSPNPAQGQAGRWNRIPSISQSLGFSYYTPPGTDFSQRTTHA